MIYVTGDTHGEVSRFEELKRKYFLSRQDTLIVAGDFGCIFGMGRRDEAKLDVLAALPYTILFLDGNHECFPEIFAYPEEMWNGGRIHRIRPNVLHLMRGQVYELNGLTVFTMGGGYSIDVMYRINGETRTERCMKKNILSGIQPGSVKCTALQRSRLNSWRQPSAGTMSCGSARIFWSGFRRWAACFRRKCIWTGTLPTEILLRLASGSLTKTSCICRSIFTPESRN